MPKQLSLDNVDIPDDVAQAYQSEEKHISNGFLSDLAGPPREQRSGHTIFANTKFKIASLALLGVAAAAVGAVTYTQLYADNTKHCVGDCQKADLNSKMHNGIMEERNALYDATWAARPKTKSRLPVTVEGPFNCVDGMASTFPCSGTDILSIVPVQNFGFNDGPTDDVWAWVDPQDGREYALVSVYEGFVIIDVSNPYNPKTIISILSPNGVTWWGDVKVYQNHAYIVSEANEGGMQVFDLTNVRSVSRDGDGPVRMEPTYHYTEFGDSHNIAINEETGFAYVVGSNTCNSGIHILDLSNPSLPTFVGCWGEDGYVHDLQVVVYNGPDTGYVGREIAFCYDEDSMAIVDLTDKLNPVMISDTTYDSVHYTHQGWLTDDQEYLLMNDEGDEIAGEFDSFSRTLIWDVRSLANPVHVNDYVSPAVAVDHNLYIKGHLAFMSNYAAGLRIVDITNIAEDGHVLEEVAFLDCYPVADNTAYEGSWSNYPYLPSGNIILSGGYEGLIMARLTPELAPIPTDSPTDSDFVATSGPTTTPESGATRLTSGTHAIATLCWVSVLSVVVQRLL